MLPSDLPSPTRGNVETDAKEPQDIAKAAEDCLKIVLFAIGGDLSPQGAHLVPDDAGDL
jgi:hypothetical protein